VVPQVSPGAEGRVANRTLKVLDATVLLQVTKVDFPPGLGECFATSAALVGHFLCWCVEVPVMLDEGALGAEALATVHALEGLLPGVRALVDVEERHMRKLLGTVGAGVGVDWGLVTPPVGGQGLLGGELLSTILAHQSLHPVVAHVCGEGGLDLRGVAALCAGEQVVALHVHLQAVLPQGDLGVGEEPTDAAQVLRLLLVLRVIVLHKSGAAPGGFATEDTEEGVGMGPLVPHQPLEMREGVAAARQAAPQLRPLLQVAQPEALHPQWPLRQDGRVARVLRQAVLVQPDPGGEGAGAALAGVAAGCRRLRRVVGGLVAAQERPPAEQFATLRAGEEGAGGPAGVQLRTVGVLGEVVGVEAEGGGEVQGAQGARQEGGAPTRLRRPLLEITIAISLGFISAFQLLNTFLPHSFYHI